MTTLRLTAIFISYIIFASSSAFSQSTYIQSDLEHHHDKPTPEEYKGKLKCANLDHIIANLENARSVPYCESAVLGCHSLKHLGEFRQHLKDIRKDSTIATTGFETELKKRLAFDLEVCELAIRHYNHGFFDRE